MADPVIHRAGLTARLVELPGGGAVPSLTRHLHQLRTAGRLPGVTDIVPGARTVLLDGEPPADLERLLAEWDGTAPEDEKPARVEIPVVYDGPDLEDVAGLTGLTPRQVVEAHTGQDAVVAFCGFAAGFAYITGLPFDVPRLSEPRTAVPAGSVGLAAGFTGVYPRRSPGGWRLIGRTDAVLWDETRVPPALLTPGTAVRFVAVGATNAGEG
jgi:KipI family sensor histidine kinase inhibitor